MRKILPLLLFVFLMGEVMGQNLVPNGGFESITNCMDGAGGIFLGNCPPWDSPTDGSCDLFNICIPNSAGTSVPLNATGYQLPHSGNGYSNILTYVDVANNYREYMQVELDSTLTSNTTYCISFFVAATNFAGLHTNNIGLYFSNLHTYISGYNYLSFTPQINFHTILSDTLNWTEISGTYLAQGGEKFIIIGNFNPDSLTDTIHSYIQSPWTSPYGFYYIDDISVIACGTVGTKETPPPEITLYPNPCVGQLTVNSESRTSGTLQQLTVKEIKIYNLLGECVYLSAINNQYTINISQLPSGLYFAEVITDKGKVRRKFVKE